LDGSLQPVVPVPKSPYPAIIRGVPGVIIGLGPISGTGVIEVTGLVSETSAMSFSGIILTPGKVGTKAFRTEPLTVGLFGSVLLAVGANDTDDGGPINVVPL
jgi:hypothetical protein